jgi:YidC/Oxa1 family membrane protein insertase
VQLVKTYTFKRGELPGGVKHAVFNDAAAPVTPQLYLQLARDGNPPAGESSFYFTFTGPAMYTDASKFQKIEFKDIEKGNADHDKAPTTAGWAWCSTTSPVGLAAARQRRASSAPPR